LFAYNPYGNDTLKRIKNPGENDHSREANSVGAEFTHLHVHSEYSLLDGHSHIKRLASQAKTLGMQALALTDHGAMYGTVEFYQACGEAGVKPIIGVEAYLSPKSLGEKTGQYEYWHLLLIAENDVGYRNLLKLTSIAHTQGYYLRPRLDRAALESYSEGLIATSSCISGEIPRLLLKEDVNGVRQALNWYREIFKDRFFLEVQDHHGKGSPQPQLNQLLYDLHRETQIPLLATNDLHYVTAEDAVSQDLLLCVQTGKTIDDPKRMRFDSNGYYLKSPDEMFVHFSHVPEALSNTMLVAERCNVKIPFGEARLPEFPIPSEFESQQVYLRYLCDKGVQERFGSDPGEQIWKKLEYELDIINSKGFTSYFLIVWDYTNYARSHGIRCLARGSAAGSLVSYVLGITNVDPLRYELLFERFLNPMRKSMPDIDMDFPDDRREDVIRYVAAKYGWDKVAQIVTFGTMAAKAAVRDVGRVLGRQSDADRLARMIPTGPKVTLTSAKESSKELEQALQVDESLRKIYDMAKTVEGSVRSTGVHAAAVVVARDPLVEYVPLQLRDYKDPNSWLIAQYEQAHIEALGLLKMDFLGLSNLTILQNTQKFIKENRGEDVDLDRLPTDGPGSLKAFNLLWLGETTGVFQFESGAMRSYLRELKPTCVEDLTAMVALYRPGPMDSIPMFIDSKHGRREVTYLHPRLEEFLKESYGVIVYQDQVLLIAVHLAGFNWLEVDSFRKAMGKKKIEEMAKYKEKFLKGCVENDIDEKIAIQLYDLIEPFSGYGFNKAHACAYAWVAYQTAYLKANYTAEFMAATLTTEANDSKKVLAAIDECKRMGVKILPPHVNHSGSGFKVEKCIDDSYGVRFGLLAIKNVGSKPIDELIAERDRNGSYRDLANLCARVDPKSVTRSAIECLIKAGALDEFGGRTCQLEGLDRAIMLANSQRKARESGQASLFGDMFSSGASSFDFVLPNIPERPEQELLAMEKELLGLYLSRHPLAHLENTLKARVTTYISYLSEEWAGQSITLGGRVVSVKSILTKKGLKMAIVQFEDPQGAIEITVFPRLYAETLDLWKEEALVFVIGKIDLREEEIRFTAEKAEAITMLVEEAPKRLYHLTLRMPRKGSDMVDRALAKDIMTIIEQYPGDDTFDIMIPLLNPSGQVAVIQPAKNTVKYCPEFHSAIEGILGSQSVKLMPIQIESQFQVAPKSAQLVEIEPEPELERDLESVVV
jgi:DNA polymerase-3 subunit alpha